MGQDGGSGFIGLVLVLCMIYALARKNCKTSWCFSLVVVCIMRFLWISRSNCAVKVPRGVGSYKNCICVRVMCNMLEAVK